MTDDDMKMLKHWIESNKTSYVETDSQEFIAYHVGFNQNVIYDLVNVIKMLRKENIYDPIYACYSGTQVQRQVEIYLVIGELEDKTELVPANLGHLWSKCTTKVIWMKEWGDTETTKKFHILDSMAYNTLTGSFWNDSVKEDMIESIQKIKLKILTEADLYDE